MIYKNILRAAFVSRPNRFIAYVRIDGQEVVCHVKNTGRCKELLVPGATVYVEKCDNPSRKTLYDLIAVEKGGLLINMDAQAPNKVAQEWLESGKFKNFTLVKPEQKYGNSRFDFYLESNEEKAFLEVKGVTLEADGVASFPDAPTERGVKHLGELIACREEGYRAYILFVIQLSPVKYFRPNWQTHPAFGEILLKAQKAGVQILAYDCLVTPDSLSLQAPVEIRLQDK